jgi:hypothetical protein
VFITPRGAHLLRSPFHRFVWRPAVKQVGLDGLRVHDLRHTSPAVAPRYQHVMADRQAQLASALDDLARAATTPGQGHAQGT